MNGRDRFAVALAQFAPVLGDVQRNVECALELATQAADAGARLVVLPELALTGYSLEDLVSEVARPIDDAVFAPLGELSRRLSIVAGFVEVGGDSALYNAAVHWEEGRPLAVHRKVYLPTYGLFDEGRFLARGRALGAFDSRLGRLGMLICEDVWHPSTLYITGQDGAQLVAVCSASPTQEVGGGAAAEIGGGWYDLLRAQALLNGLFIVFVNRVGFEDGVNFWGGSVVVGPEGRERARAPLFEPGLTLVEIDMGDVLRARTRSQHVWEEDAEFTRRVLGEVLQRRQRARALPPASGRERPEQEPEHDPARKQEPESER